MRGLNPRIHDASPSMGTLRMEPPNVIMDCRVKPGNDRLN
jgi:hypothetical protein